MKKSFNVRVIERIVFSFDLIDFFLIFFLLDKIKKHFRGKKKKNFPLGKILNTFFFFFKTLKKKKKLIKGFFKNNLK